MDINIYVFESSRKGSAYIFPKEVCIHFRKFQKEVNICYLKVQDRSQHILFRKFQKDVLVSLSLYIYRCIYIYINKYKQIHKPRKISIYACCFFRKFKKQVGISFFEYSEKRPAYMFSKVLERCKKIESSRKRSTYIFQKFRKEVNPYCPNFQKEVGINSFESSRKWSTHFSRCF